MKWRCEKLSMTALNNPCESARKRGTFACIGCDGAVQIMEGVKMSTRKKTFCNVKGCDRWAQIGGMCKAHANGSAPKPQIFKTPVVDAPVVESVVTPEPAPVVKRDEFHFVSLVEIFKQRQEAQLVEFMAGLDRCDSDLDRIKYAYDMVMA